MNNAGSSRYTYEYIHGISSEEQSVERWNQQQQHGLLTPVTTHTYEPIVAPLETAQSSSSTQFTPMDTCSGSYQELQTVSTAAITQQQQQDVMTSPVMTSPRSSFTSVSYSPIKRRKFELASHDYIEMENVLTDNDLRISTTKEANNHEIIDSRHNNTSVEGDMSDEEEDANVVSLHKVLKIRDVKQIKYKRPRRGCNDLPQDLEGLMGQANLFYVNNDKDKAQQICINIIKEAPYASKPYDLLAEIFELDSDISLSCRLVAAHLSSGVSSETWEDLANQCLERGESQKAIDCYKKATKTNSNDAELMAKAARMHRNLGNFSQAMFYYQKKIAAFPKQLGEKAVKEAFDFAMECWEHKELELAGTMLRRALTHHRTYFGDKECNTLCELLAMTKKYQMTLECLAEAGRIVLIFNKPVVEYSDDEGDKEDMQQSSNKDKIDFALLTAVHISEKLAIDLQCKAIVATIRMRRKGLVKNAVDKVLQLNPTDIVEILYDIGNAYMKMEAWKEALIVLNKILNCKNYQENAEKILLKRSECLTNLKKYPEAVVDLCKCVEQAPHHVGARLSLCNAYVRVHEYRKAITTLDDVDKYDFDLNGSERMQLLKQRYEIFLKWAARPGKKKKLTSAADVLAIMFANKLRQSFTGNLAIRRRTRKSNNPNAGEIRICRYSIHQQQIDAEDFMDADESFFNTDEWLELYRKLLDLLNTCKRYKEATIINQAVIDSRPLSSRIKREKLELVGLRLSLLAGWHQFAYDYIRMWVIRTLRDGNVVPQQIWNIFNQVVMRADDGRQRHHKFCTRQLEKNPNIVSLSFLKAHDGIMNGKYRFALTEYIKILHQFPDDPLLKLLIGVIFIHIMVQKTTGRKHAYLTQAFAFFTNYAESRGYTQETKYNIGRALQQLGLHHFATHMYEEALKQPPPAIQHFDDSLSSDYYNLKNEIAYNLSLIYRKSGNHTMANHLLLTHCVV